MLRTFFAGSGARGGRNRFALRFRLFASFTVVLVAIITGGMAPGFSSVHGASLKPPPPASGFVPTPNRVSGSWDALFQLVPGETYTYHLTHDMLRGREHRVGSGDRLHGLSRPGAGAGGSAESGPGVTGWVSFPGGVIRFPGPHITGELNFTRVGNRDEIRYWFDVDGVRANGTAPNDVRALAGAVLVAALTGEKPMSSEGVRLLATAFQWTHWYDMFASSTFRDGLVWQISQNPPYRFAASPLSGRYQYWGELLRGRELVLEMGVDVRDPLPWDVIAYDGRDYYRAELSVASPGSQW